MSGILTREDDLRLLEALYLRENLGLPYDQVAPHIPTRAGTPMSPRGIMGMINRVRRAAAMHPCLCRRPENRDGGMPERWWAA